MKALEQGKSVLTPWLSSWRGCGGRSFYYYRGALARGWIARPSAAVWTTRARGCADLVQPLHEHEVPLFRAELAQQPPLRRAIGHHGSGFRGRRARSRRGR
jgi:hypothetical protein